MAGIGLCVRVQFMPINEYLQEYDLEIDDVRWYLSMRLSERVLQYQDDPVSLARLIWSGEMEEGLYNMEERYLEKLQADLDRGICDESKLRQTLEEIDTARRERPRGGGDRDGRAYP